VTVPFIQRELALAAVALLGAVVALAVAARHHARAVLPLRLPQPAVSELSGWYTALAGMRTRPLAGRPSACNTLLSPKTLGVDHPVLPCGVKVFVSYGGKTALTTVVDRGPVQPGHEFELTPALAERLGLTGVQTIRWSFAQPS
jgi:hypothetical protein